MEVETLEKALLKSFEDFTGTRPDAEEELDEAQPDPAMENVNEAPPLVSEEGPKSDNAIMARVTTTRVVFGSPECVEVSIRAMNDAFVGVTAVHVNLCGADVGMLVPFLMTCSFAIPWQQYGIPYLSSTWITIGFW